MEENTEPAKLGVRLYAGNLLVAVSNDRELWAEVIGKIIIEDALKAADDILGG